MFILGQLTQLKQSLEESGEQCYHFVDEQDSQGSIDLYHYTAAMQCLRYSIDSSNLQI